MILAFGGAAVLGGLMPWRRKIVAWLSNLPDRLGESSKGVAIAGSAAGAIMLLSLGYFGPGLGLGLAGGGRVLTGGTSGGGFVYGAPNTPTGTVVVIDTSTVYFLGSAFVGSGDDTHDSTQFQIDTLLGGNFSSPIADSVTGAQIRDTISANAKMTANVSYQARWRYKGAAAKSATWSAWSAPDTFINSPIPVPSGSIRFDMRAGGAHDIQAGGVTNLAQALSATGMSEYDPGAGDIDFTTDADGAGTNAFRMDWPGISAGAETDMAIYRSMPSLTTGEIYAQWKIWQSRTASGGGIGTAGDWDCCSQGPGSGKRLVWRTGPGEDGRFTFAPAKGTAEFFIQNSYNPAYASVVVDWDDYVSQWFTITIRLKPETSGGAGDGIIEAWFNSTKIYSNLAATTRTEMWDTEFEWGGPTWIGTPQDQTMYLTDLVVWQP